MYEGLDRAGYTLTGWGFSMWDFNWWRATKPERLASRLAARASDGSIVVMHDGHHKNPRADRQRTVDATAEIIPMLRKRGFVFGTLCPAEPGRTLASSGR
jgi:peptidoglycan/xylan/chitin deacetylase (PgdA/CDA1 family)